MKKIICALLALCLALSVCVPAFAEKKEEYPLIVISGMDFTDGLYYNLGEENESKVGVNVDVKEIAGTLLRAFVKGVTSFSPAKGWQEIWDYAGEVFAPYACDKNGDSKPGVSNPVYPLSAGSYDRFTCESGSGEGGLVNSAVTRYGGDRVWFMFYDWRIDPRENAATLNTTVETALAETGSDKVNIVCCSMGGLVALTYLTEYGHGSVNALVSDSSVMYGTDVVTELFTGQYNFDADTVTRFLCRLLPEYSGALKLLNRTGLVKALCAVVTKVAGKYEKDIFDTVILSSFGTMPALWSLVYNDSYETARSYMFSGHEEEYAGLIAKTDAIQSEIIANRKSTLDAAIADGMHFAIVTGYNSPNAPAYKSAGLQGDGTLETGPMSFGATVSEVGSVLSEEELEGVDPALISPDRCINASTCEYPDYTWFVRDSSHVGCQYNSDYTMLIFALIESDEQPTVGSFEEYPRFMTADEHENLSPNEWVEPASAKGPVC